MSEAFEDSHVTDAGEESRRALDHDLAEQDKFWDEAEHAVRHGLITEEQAAHTYYQTRGVSAVGSQLEL